MTTKKTCMMILFLAAASAACAASLPSVAPDRVKTPLAVDMPRIGTLAPRTAADVGESMWTIGCECLDPDSASFKESNRRVDIVAKHKKSDLAHRTFFRLQDAPSGRFRG